MEMVLNNVGEELFYMEKEQIYVRQELLDVEMLLINVGEEFPDMEKEHFYVGQEFFYMEKLLNNVGEELFYIAEDLNNVVLKVGEIPNYLR